MCKAILKLSKGIPVKDAQEIIQELEYRRTNSIVNNSIRYFAKLITLYKKGEFVSAIEAEKEQVTHEQEEKKAKHLANQERLKSEEEKKQEDHEKQEARKAEIMRGISNSKMLELKNLFISKEKKERSLAWNFYCQSGFDNRLVKVSFEKFIMEQVAQWVPPFKIESLK